jgi:hypothetical protein
MYAELWAAIVLGDPDGIRQVNSRHFIATITMATTTTIPQASKSLGVGDYYPLLASMLTNRPWGDVVGRGAASSRLRERNTASDRAQIRGYAQQYLTQIVTVLEYVTPSPLLLLFHNPVLSSPPKPLAFGFNPSQACSPRHAPPLQDQRLPPPRRAAATWSCRFIARYPQILSQSPVGVQCHRSERGWGWSEIGWSRDIEYARWKDVGAAESEDVLAETSPSVRESHA